MSIADVHAMLGLVWNVRDKSVAWVNALSRIVDRHEGNAPRYDDGEWRAVFPASRPRRNPVDKLPPCPI